MTRGVAIACAALACTAAGLGAARAVELRLVGWVEPVALTEDHYRVGAKLDTGADNSSLHARNIERFERDGERWVRFDVRLLDRRLVTLERPLVRTVRIRTHDETLDRRPVVMLGVCLGDIYKTVQVNLVDRRGYKYCMLIGRSFLAGSVVVDPSRKHLTQPNCGDAAR